MSNRTRPSEITGITGRKWICWLSAREDLAAERDPKPDDPPWLAPSAPVSRYGDVSTSPVHELQRARPR